MPVGGRLQPVIHITRNSSPFCYFTGSSTISTGKGCALSS